MSYLFISNCQMSDVLSSQLVTEGLKKVKMLMTLLKLIHLVICVPY